MKLSRMIEIITVLLNKKQLPRQNLRNGLAYRCEPSTAI